MSEETRTFSDKFMLRLPDGMRDRIKRAAEKNGRSMNAEIVQALEFYFPPEPNLKETVADIEDTIRLLRGFKGNELLYHLADQLDGLVSDVSKSLSLTEAERAAAREHSNAHARPLRVAPPPDDF